MYWVDMAAGSAAPQPAATLLFGSQLLTTDVDVRARSLTGVVTPEGTLHLVWVTSYGETDDLGYTWLQP